MGIPTDSPLLSLPLFKVAATAAAALAAAVEVMLLRRVTRWFGLTAPSETECTW